jgi:hypothetical protein
MRRIELVMEGFSAETKMILAGYALAHAKELQPKTGEANA